MSVIDAPLSSNNQKFLKKHFQVYDAVTQGVHCDFGVLRGCKVVLIGETHGHPHMVTAQNEFFQRFLKEGDALFLESAPPECNFVKENCPAWSSLPPRMVIGGSDIRCKNVGIKEAVEFRTATQNWIINCLRLTKAIKEVFKQAIFFANEELRQERAHITDGCLQLSKQASEELDKFCDEENQLRGENYAMQEKIPNIDDSDEIALLKSNQGLGLTLIKAATDPSIGKIAAVWGSEHFNGKTEIFHMLEKAGLKYVVLVPSLRDSQKGEKIKKPSKVALKFFFQEGNRRLTTTWQMDASSAPYCDPALARILKPLERQKPKKTSIWIDPLFLRTHESLTVQPNECLCFPGIHVPEELDGQFSEDALLDLLKPLYLSAQRRVLFDYSEPRFRIKFTSKQELYLKIYSKNPFNLQIVPQIITTPFKLWEHLCRIRATEYRLPENVTLILRGCEGGNFENLQELFHSKIEALLPDGRRFVVWIQNTYNINSASVDSQEKNALRITSDKGLTFVLERPVENHLPRLP